MPRNADRCLRGLRVLDFTRVIAGPVAGKTLAAHGMDVSWVTSEKVATLPGLDVNVQRGKRAVRLELDRGKNRKGDIEVLRKLVEGSDVFLQSYRPRSFVRRGLGAEDVAGMKPGIVYASLSAWGSEGP